jgi:hypothetical protein
MSVNVAIVDLTRLSTGFSQSGTILRALVSTTSGVTLWVVRRPLRSNLETGLSFVREDELQDERF